MALAGAVFYNDYLPNSDTVLYTVPGGKTVYLSFGYWKNMAASTETPLVSIDDGTGSVTQITPGYSTGVGQYYSDDFISKTITLTAGMKIRGQTTNATAVRLIISGGIE